MCAHIVDFVDYGFDHGVLVDENFGDDMLVWQVFVFEV